MRESQACRKTLQKRCNGIVRRVQTVPATRASVGGPSANHIFIRLWHSLHVDSQELIASLKARVEAAERRARCYEAGAGASASVAGDRSLSILGSVRGVSTTPGPATRDDFAEREERERLEKAHKRELLVKDKKVQDLEVESECACEPQV